MYAMFLLTQTRSSCSDGPSQDSCPKEITMEDRAKESSSDSETRDDTPYEWTAMVRKFYPFLLVSIEQHVTLS